jgi:hypothetical protein
MGMAKVLEALTKINADTERLNQRMTIIEASTSTLSRSWSSVPVDSALAWRNFRARDWQRGLVFVCKPGSICDSAVIIAEYRQIRYRSKDI